jgi:hypothetical protein
MSDMPVRPTEGSQITVLVIVAGHPVTHVALAGRVTPSTLIVPRKTDERRWGVEPQGEADVLFVHNHRLFRWPMRVEEVLPTSYYLVSLQDPRDGERREFVRAMADLEVRLTPKGQPRGAFKVLSVELSASGMRVATDLPAAPEDLVEVTLRMDASADARTSLITAMARVVRVLHPEAVRELALEFVELKSADEDRLLQMVFRLREASLYARLGRRSFM